MIGPIATPRSSEPEFDADLSFQEALDRVRDAVLEACARQELPFDILAARLAEEAGLDPASLTQVVFVLQNAFRRSLRLPDVKVEPFVYREGQPVMPINRSWMTMTLKETPSGITGACHYKQDLFEASTFSNWATDYETILAKAAENPEVSLRKLAEH